MKNYLIIFIVLIQFSCNTSTPEEKLKNVNGYWQIDQVEVDKDSVINYNLSQFIDYIEIKDSIGFRKKLKPKIDGGYIATETSEDVKARIQNNDLFLYYTTPFDSWKEEVLEATGEHLVIQAADGKKYHYIKHEPLLIANENEKTQE